MGNVFDDSVGDEITGNHISELGDVTPGQKTKTPNRPAVVNPHPGKISAEEFRQMSEYCNKLTEEMLMIFLRFQEKFKEAALAFTAMAAQLENDAKLIDRRTHIENSD